MDYRLNFNTHYRHMKEIILKDINLFKKLSNVHGGAHPSTMINLYKALIGSKLSYANILTNENNRNHTQIIQTITNKTLRICLGLTKTTPIAALIAEAGVLPYKQQNRLQTIKFLAKNFYNNTAVTKQLMNNELISKFKNIIDMNFRN